MQSGHRSATARVGSARARRVFGGGFRVGNARERYPGPAQKFLPGGLRRWQPLLPKSAPPHAPRPRRRAAVAETTLHSKWRSVRCCPYLQLPVFRALLVAPFGLTIATLHTKCFSETRGGAACEITMRWRPNQLSRLRPDPSTRPSSPNSTTLAELDHARRTPQLADVAPARRTAQLAERPAKTASAFANDWWPRRRRDSSAHCVFNV
jgi:hypothetical protein